MGWLFRRGPLLHLNSYVREICGTYEAYEVEVAGSPTEITKENLRRGNYEHEHIEGWFLTRATKDGEPVICQMLVDFDATAKGATGLPAFDDEAGREYPHDNPLVQAWGYKVLDSGSGFGSYTCPMRFLDAAPIVRGEHDEAWRAQMRSRAGTML